VLFDADRSNSNGYSLRMETQTVDRPSFEEVYMHFAESISQRSTCKRLRVGTVITTTDFRKVLAVGYNGNASGLPDRCDRDEPGNCGCLHSEENAVINCDSPRGIEKFVFVTHLPCVACAKRLINLGNVRKIYYARDYRLRDSLELLALAKIEVVHLENDFS
jgi:dCMP deaminase